jgi:hypothetical protein
MASGSSGNEPESGSKSGEGEGEAAAAAGGGARRQLISWARTALPAIVSAIGISGFVSLLGAGVLYIRFGAAGIPAAQAIGDIPKGDLLVTGAVTLVLYLVLGLLAVLVVYLLQGAVLKEVFAGATAADDTDEAGAQAGVAPQGPNPLKSLKRERKVVAARVAQLDAAIAAFEPTDKTAAEENKEENTSAGSKGTAEPPNPEPQNDDPLASLRKERKDAAGRQDKLDGMIYKLRVAKASGGGAKRGAWGLVGLIALEASLVLVRAEVGTGLKVAAITLVAIAGTLGITYEATGLQGTRETIRKRTFENESLVLIGLSALVLAVTLLVRSIVGQAGWVVLPLVISLVLGAITWMIGRLHPRRFFWYGLSIFISVALFGATVTYSRTINAPSGQAAAVLLKDGCTVRGIWIGESSTRVFLARVSVERKPTKDNPGNVNVNPGSVFWVAKEEVISESIGTLVQLPDAILESERLEAQLRTTNSLLAAKPASCAHISPVTESELKPLPKSGKSAGGTSGGGSAAGASQQTEDAKKKQEEAKVKREEAKTKGEEAKAKEEAARKAHEQQGKTKAEEAKAKEEEAKAKEEEAKAKEEEAKAKEEEANAKEEEAKQKAEEAKTKQREANKQKAEKKQNGWGKRRRRRHCHHHSGGNSNVLARAGAARSIAA